jgi:hypothetical protein
MPMTLAEALSERADANQQLNELAERIHAASTHQEGDAPVENPTPLVEECLSLHNRIEELTIAINEANNEARLPDGSKTLMEAIAERDKVARLRKFHQGIVQSTNVGMRGFRLARAEIKTVVHPNISIPRLNDKIAELSRRHRKLDQQIQKANHTNNVRL